MPVLLDAGAEHLDTAVAELAVSVVKHFGCWCRSVGGGLGRWVVEPAVSILGAGVAELAASVPAAGCWAGVEHFGCWCCLTPAPSISDAGVAEPAVSLLDVGLLSRPVHPGCLGC